MEWHCCVAHGIAHRFSSALEQINNTTSSRNLHTHRQHVDEAADELHVATCAAAVVGHADQHLVL
eukprot:scaffold32972_cov28-Tisochrysis_lutea.AAC.4